MQIINKVFFLVVWDVPLFGLVVFGWVFFLFVLQETHAWKQPEVYESSFLSQWNNSSV